MSITIRQDVIDVMLEWCPAVCDLHFRQSVPIGAVLWLIQVPAGVSIEGDAVADALVRTKSRSGDVTSSDFATIVATVRMRD